MASAPPPSPSPIETYGITEANNPGRIPLDNALSIELSMMCDPGLRRYYNTNTDANFHFWRCCSGLWGSGARVKINWNPWADEFVSELFSNQYLGVSGCASSGKTRIAAAYAILRWLDFPLHTKVLVTSTSLKEAKKRIWGAIRELYLGAAGKMPGKLVDSQGQIRCDTDHSSDLSGIELVAGDPSKENENVKKLIGIKNQQVILIADEMPELSPSLIEAARGNLISNDFFQMVGLGNFKSIVDAFGMFTEPLHGWKSVNVNTKEWPMKMGGKCIRFDGLESPNVKAGQIVYEGIYGPRQLEEHMKLKPTSPTFMRMCRSFMATEGDESQIYSESDLLVGGALDQTPVIWREDPTPVSFTDPAFVTGGDDCIQATGLLGIEAGTNLLVLECGPMFKLDEDVTRTALRPASFQKCDQIMQNCEGRRVKPEHAGVDATGAGLAFADVLFNVWSSKCLKIFFGGAASEKPLSDMDPRPGHEAYVNRVSEIWYQGLEFVRGHQIRRLPNRVVQELTERRHTTQKGISGLRIKVERKEEMKLRLQRSPDHADAFLGMLELCRTRLKFQPGGYRSEVAKQSDPKQEYSEVAKQADDVYDEECLMAGADY